MRPRTILLTVLVAAGCATDPTAPPPTPLTALPRALTVQEGAVLQRSNGFAFDLFRRAAAAPDSNAFISPLSVSMALSMTMNGAANATLDSMRLALGFGAMPLADINAGYRGLIDLLRGLDPTTDIRVANSVWFRQPLVADPGFSAALLASYDAAVRPLDFDAPSAPKTINDWASAATNGRIPKVIEAIPDEIVMYLLNAIYFKGKWVEPFEKAATVNGPFAAAFGGPQSVPMMSQTMTVRALQRPGVMIAELPYGNDAFAMDLVMPAPGGDVAALLDTLTTARWEEWTAALQPSRYHVSLPRFKLKYERSLNDDLRALGMGNAFEDGVADFRNIFSPNEKGPFISFVKHDTFLEVNEAGTEAAAVTTIGIGLTSGPPSFVVDRPFLLVIRERFSGTILFLGKILRVPQ